MDYGKHVAPASHISLAIMALGFIALYTIWINLGIDKTFRLYNQFEHILTARNILVKRSWSDGAEVTVKSLFENNGLLSLTLNSFPVACKKRKDLSCEDEKTQREFLFGVTLKEMEQKLPRTRRFEFTEVKSEYGGNCSAIFFRGKDEETFWIKGISSAVAFSQGQDSFSYSTIPGIAKVSGSLIYYVRPSHECRFSPEIWFNTPGFFLVDLRSIGKEWNFHAQESVMRDIHSEVGYRMSVNSFKEAEDWYRENFSDTSFDIDRFFEQLPDSYRESFMYDVPSTFLTEPVNGIESRIIGGAYIKTGTLYDKFEIDKALSAVYSFERLSPTFGGVGTNLQLFVSIAPIILLSFSFFFWYHVKRIVQSDAQYNDPWIFLDVEGVVEKGFVVIWAAILMLTPASITWACLLVYDASLPTIGQIRAWVGLDSGSIAQMIREYSILSVPATLGGIVIVVGELFIVHSLHLLLKRRWVTYSRFCTTIKSWFISLVCLGINSVKQLHRRTIKRR